MGSATYYPHINNDLVSEFVKAIGANGMILGQMIDLLSEKAIAVTDITQRKCWITCY